MTFERVHTMTDFYDGPRGGIADFGGHPHLYESEWDDVANNFATTFRLSPVPPDVLALALEDWAIWERWLTAFQRGCTTQDTHPALPEDRARHDALEGLLRERLRIDPENFVRASAEFRTAPDWDGEDPAPVEVRWSAVE
ncbi:MAG: hypothetical protein QM820_61010 [Minicystis sp.]